MLANRVALVTGSTSGIGLGIARALAGAGATVVLHGLGTDGDADAAVRTALGPDAERARWCARHDLRERGSAEALLAFAISAAGRAPDILVNNAGVQRVAPIVELDDDSWDAVLAVNLTAAFRLTRAALPPMLAAGWGRVVNVASVHGKVGSVHKAAYVAAKHGLLGLTKVTRALRIGEGEGWNVGSCPAPVASHRNAPRAPGRRSSLAASAQLPSRVPAPRPLTADPSRQVTALETAGTGVSCAAICPGWVLTPLVQAQLDALARSRVLAPADAAAALLAEKQPSGAFVTPEAVGALAVFLCSEHGAHVTGEGVSIDGGWGAR